MPVTPRVRALVLAGICLLSGAATIPAFANDTTILPTEPPAAVASHPPASDNARVVTELDAVPVAERGDTSTGLSGRLRVHLLSPGSTKPGVYAVPGGVDGHPFAFLGVIPFSTKLGPSVGTYHVGFWPAELHTVRSEAYENPTGFVEVTAQNADLPVSAHLRLGDLVTHDRAPFPKYIVLREALLDKLELVLADLEMRGVPTQHIVVLSGFRTPAYNLALGDASGRARESRHQYGDAADIIIDADSDGRMDDLNGDGRVDAADVRVIESAVNRVEQAHPTLAGGLGLYQTMGPSGPFAHIDVRGTRARWGTLDDGARTVGRWASRSGRGESSHAASHCHAEGASAVLCQGFRYSR